jgi:hypothetical protein
MNPELQQRIQNLMGDNSQPNLVTTEMPSESDFGQYSSVSVLPKSDNNGLVEGKDYVTVGGQMFWPWELEGIMGKDGAFDAKAVNQFIESLPQKPNLKELSSLRDFANPPSSTREVSNLMGATLSPMKSGQFSDREIDLYRKSLGMAEGGEVGFDPMRVPSIDKKDLTSSINTLMDQEVIDYDMSGDRPLEEVEINLSPSERMNMILDQTGIRSEEDLLKIEPYLPDLGAGASLQDRLSALPLKALPFIKKTLIGLNQSVADDAQALIKSKSIPEALLNASKFYPPTMKAGIAKDAISAGINALRKAEGGEVSREEMMMQAMEGEAEGQANPDEAIRSSIEELLAQASQTEDPSERDQYLHLAEAAEIGAEAPMAQAAKELAQAGRGEDTHLAHLRAGEVVIPPEAFEDEEFEGLIEKKFRELDIDPERMVVGVGIASLNPITGLEEFGFFKKLARGVKKVVKKVIKPLAKFAQFLPPPVGPIAALANKAFTVYDVAKGRASPLALLTMGKGVPAGGGSGGISSLFGGVKEFVTKGADGVGLLGNLNKGLGSLFTGPGADKFGRFGKLGDLVTGPGADKIGRFGRLGDFAGGIGDALGVTNYAGQAAQAGQFGQAVQAGQMQGAPKLIQVGEGETPMDALTRSLGEYAEGSPEHDFIKESLDLLSMNNPTATAGQFVSDFNNQAMDFYNKYGGQNVAGQNPSGGLFSGGGADGKGNFGLAGDLLGGLTDKLGLTNYSGNAGSGNRGFDLGGLGGAGIAAVLAKLAYDEAKNRKGVQLTPAMTMSRYGGYQLAKRDAEAAGEAPPDRKDFGMMEDMPVLTGGRKTPVAEEPVAGMRYGGEVIPMQMRYGGMVPMAYATGGNVSTEDFKKKNGKINGEGTETSDDIPAMLSDGEFVMTGRAVRGAGSFDMDSNNGIITLTPKGGEDRDKGTQLMYEMMELFAEYADKPKAKRVKAA